jgi:hypothetical protein
MVAAILYFCVFFISENNNGKNYGFNIQLSCISNRGKNQ